MFPAERATPLRQVKYRVPETTFQIRNFGACHSTARLYTSKRGKSGSTRPISKKSPPWCKYTPEEVESLVLKLAREGNSQSAIGMLLRDRYSVPLVKSLTGKNIQEILKTAQQSGNIPDDLNSLLKTADALRRHLERNRKDHVNKRSLAMIESKIHRLAKYYRSRGMLQPDWEYKHVVASVA